MQELPLFKNTSFNVGFTGTPGWYILVFTATGGMGGTPVTYSLQLAPPEVYITGASQSGGPGDTSEAYRFTVPAGKTGKFTYTVPDSYVSGDALRIFARLPGGVEWWRSEFLPYGGKIEYRENRGELDKLGMSATVSPGDVISLGFTDGSAGITSGTAD